MKTPRDSDFVNDDVSDKHSVKIIRAKSRRGDESPRP